MVLYPSIIVFKPVTQFLETKSHEEEYSQISQRLFPVFLSFSSNNGSKTSGIGAFLTLPRYEGVTSLIAL